MDVPRDPDSKRCSLCRETKPLTDFYRRSDDRNRVTSRCRVCLIVTTTEYRKRAIAAGKRYLQRRSPAGRAALLVSNARWDQKNVERMRIVNRAKCAVRRAIQKGSLARGESCEFCGTASVSTEAAHHDYSRPLEVKWLCRSCHRRWDRQQPKTLAAGKRS
jgi:hypothetical protein